MYKKDYPCLPVDFGIYFMEFNFPFFSELRARKKQLRGQKMFAADTKQVSENFNSKTMRDAVAAPYFASQGFYNTLRSAIKTVIIRQGNSHVYLTPQVLSLTPQKQDLPYIQKTFTKLKEEFPDLDHIRVREGDICLDTQKPGVMRQLGRALNMELPTYTGSW